MAALLRREMSSREGEEGRVVLERKADAAADDRVNSAVKVTCHTSHVTRHTSHPAFQKATRAALLDKILLGSTGGHREKEKEVTCDV